MIGIFSNLKGWEFDCEFLVSNVVDFLDKNIDSKRIVFSLSPSVCMPVCEFALNSGDCSKFRMISPSPFNVEKGKFENEKINSLFKFYFQKYGGSFETISQFLFEEGEVLIDNPLHSFSKCGKVLQISKKEDALKFNDCETSLCDPFDNLFEENPTLKLLLVKGDALSFKKWDTVIHCANIFHTMGAGIAKQIANDYPWAFRADKETICGDTEKIGSFSIGENPEKTQRIINLYGQKGIGNNGHPLARNARYDALFDAFYLIFERAAKKEWKVAIPYGIASNLAGGDWDIVAAIIKSAWKHNPVETYIVKFED